MSEQEIGRFIKKLILNLEAVEGQEVTLNDVASAIESDCFSSDSSGLRLLARTLKCHLSVKKNSYEFTVGWNNCLDSYLQKIVEQFKL